MSPGKFNNVLEYHLFIQTQLSKVPGDLQRHSRFALHYLQNIRESINTMNRILSYFKMFYVIFLLYGILSYEITRLAFDKRGRISFLCWNYVDAPQI